jgi:hypothetical protein
VDPRPPGDSDRARGDTWGNRWVTQWPFVDPWKNGGKNLKNDENWLFYAIFNGKIMVK